MSSQNLKKVSIAILGAGIAGLSAAYTLRCSGHDALVFEKSDHYGGLCSSFSVDGFTFDTFAHLTFSKDPYVNSIFEEQANFLIHPPEALNYYKGTWIRNPAQNNLFPLSIDEKIEVIKGFICRKDMPVVTYDDWLKNQYGTYFAENFPTKYTRKYWTVEPRELEPQWVEGRMYKPTIDEVLRGAMSEDTPNVHYSKEMHYPKNGGFQSFLSPLAKEANIRLLQEVSKIDSKNKILHFLNGEAIGYEHLISTIPLTELPLLMVDMPGDVRRAAGKLEYTSGIMISLGFQREHVSPALWFYIYDEEIWPARVYSPSIKSPNNAPAGCSSIQAEIYFSRRKPLPADSKSIAEQAIEQLEQMGLFCKDEIVAKNVQTAKYANILFTPEIYANRKLVCDYLDSVGIVYAGRFGEWDYLWTDQSLLSGKRAAEKLLARQQFE